MSTLLELRWQLYHLVGQLDEYTEALAQRGCCLHCGEKFDQCGYYTSLWSVANAAQHLAEMLEAD